MEDYQKNVYQQFRATTKFHLGKLGSDLPEGAIIEFDGTTAKIDGEEVMLPSLRGAVTAGWLVEASDNVSRYIPKRSEIFVSPSTNAGSKDRSKIALAEIEDDEVEVNTLERSNASRASALENSISPKKAVTSAVVEDFADLSEALMEADNAENSYTNSEIARLKKRLAELEASQAPAKKPVQASLPKMPVQVRSETPVKKAEPTPVKKYAVVQDENETGVQIPSVQKSALQAAVAKAEATQPKQGVKEGVVVSRFKTGTQFSANVKDANVLRQELAKQSAIEASLEHRKVATTAKKVVPPPKATGDVETAKEGESLMDLLPDAVHQISPVTSKEATVTATNSDDKIGTITIQTTEGAEIAWDKTPHWSTRVKTAIHQFGNDPETLKAIANVEDAGVRKALLERAQAATNADGNPN